MGALIKIISEARGMPKFQIAKFFSFILSEVVGSSRGVTRTGDIFENGDTIK